MRAYTKSNIKTLSVGATYRNPNAGPLRAAGLPSVCMDLEGLMASKASFDEIKYQDVPASGRSGADMTSYALWASLVGRAGAILLLIGARALALQEAASHQQITRARWADASGQELVALAGVSLWT